MSAQWRVMVALLSGNETFAVLICISGGIWTRSPSRPAWQGTRPPLCTGPGPDAGTLGGHMTAWQRLPGSGRRVKRSWAILRANEHFRLFLVPFGLNLVSNFIIARIRHHSFMML